MIGTWLIIIIIINFGKCVPVLTETLRQESIWEIRGIAPRTVDFGSVALEEGVWSASRPGHFNSCTQWIGIEPSFLRHPARRLYSTTSELSSLKQEKQQMIF
jgi:hypothetical protein